MNRLKIGIFILAIVLLGGFLYKNSFFKSSPKTTEVPKQLKIVSTNPTPLEGATILPTQYIEINFNYPIVDSEFKHKLDPELDHEIQVFNGKNSRWGQTMRIVFKKPLQLGSGLTLFILGNTHTEDGLKLNQDFIYHIRTIGYKGV